MNFMDIKKVDVANGPGVRVSLFVSGCPHHCPGCFNPESWDFGSGRPFGQARVEELVAMLKEPYAKGLSLLGGEPFAPENQKAVLDLVKQVRDRKMGKDIWCWTGYLFEDLAAGKVGDYGQELLEHLDVLVDGPFLLDKKDLSLRFRGSSNQRVIDVPRSLRMGTAQLQLEI